MTETLDNSSTDADELWLCPECPRCQYDLQGIDNRSVCPECGLDIPRGTVVLLGRRRRLRTLLPPPIVWFITAAVGLLILVLTWDPIVAALSLTSLIAIIVGAILLIMLDHRLRGQRQRMLVATPAGMAFMRCLGTPSETVPWH
ncbi:MAG: hypothetical protein AAF432_06815 [Planctomycetota bacterium]